MLKQFRFALVVFVSISGVLPVQAQTRPCIAGTLADVLGTSCSVGPLTLNFQNNFSGSHNVFVHGIKTSVPINPAEIEFTPINLDNQAGFKLTTNFIDAPGPDSTFLGGHSVNFSYTPQARPGFDIVGESLQMDATVQGDALNDATEEVFDFQNYANISFTSVNTTLASQGGNIISHLTDHILLPAPALFSTGFAGHPELATTDFQTLTTGTAQGTLQGATFLYNMGPVGPLPPAALIYSSLNLPGTAGTFVSSITNSGRMAGAYQDIQGVFHGYVTQGAGGFITIDFPTAASTFANGLNDQGDIVGSYTDVAGNTHGFILQDKGFTTLDFPEAIFTDPIAINNRQQIVGIYETADQGIHGFLFDRGSFTSIDHNPDNFTPPFTEVLGINNSGHIVGSFIEAVTLVGLVQQEDMFQTLIVPGQVETVINSLNEQGDQVGTYNDIDLLQHGFVRKAELFQTVDFPNGSSTFPLAMNASGKIVGQYADAAGNFHSFMADPHGNNGDGLQALTNDTTLRPTTAAISQLAPLRVCGGAEWRQHPEQIRNPGSCQVKH